MFSFLNWESRSGQFLAAAVRIAFGVLLLVAAPSNRYPTGMRLLGVLFALSGLAYALMPGDGWTDLIQWLSGEGEGFYRLGGAAGGVLAGAFLVEATKPEPTTV